MSETHRRGKIADLIYAAELVLALDKCNKQSTSLVTSEAITEDNTSSDSNHRFTVDCDQSPITLKTNNMNQYSYIQSTTNVGKQSNNQHQLIMPTRKLSLPTKHNPVIEINSNHITNYYQNSKNSHVKRECCVEKILVKPPFSYAQLIIQAINSSETGKMTLSNIYNYISATYKFYDMSDKGWQNSIRHNLSLNKYFIKLPRRNEETGKGSYWIIDPIKKDELIAHSIKKKKTT